MTGSKHWLVIHDNEQNGDPVLEFPVGADNLMHEMERLQHEYPLPRYSMSSYGSSHPIESGIAEAKSWEASDYFSDMIHEERERKEREARQKNEVVILLGGPGAGKGTQGKRLGAT